MLTVDEHVRIVHQIIQENVALERGLQSPGFRKLLASVLAGRAPAENSLPWLMLPIFACEALGGDLHRIQHVAAALEIGRIAAGCLDECQDQDTDGALWRTVGPTRTVNLGVGMLLLSFLALSRLSELGAEPSLVLNLHEEFQATVLDMSAGQDADVRNDVSLDDYEQVAGAKSGSLLRLGCRAGAIVAGAPRDVVARYGEFGYNLGIVAQMWNDLEGLAGLHG
jgi:geranylgeranyl pyrophosphate synthase